MRYRLTLALGVWVFGMIVSNLLTLVSGRQMDTYAEGMRQKLSKVRAPDPNIVLAGLDEEAMMPEVFHRKTHARVLKNLKAAGVKLVFFDLVFDEDRAPEADAAFKEALSDAPPTVLAGTTGQVYQGDELTRRSAILAPALAEVLETSNVVLGLIENPASTAGARWPYFLALDLGDGPQASAALAMYGLYQSVNPRDFKYQPDGVVVPPVKIPLEVQSTGADVTYVFDVGFHPAATGPNHVPGSGTYRVIPYMELVDPAPELMDSLRGRIVVIGENTATESDAFDTPVGVMKGFEIHAQVFDRLLHQDFTTMLSAEANGWLTVALVTLVASLALVTWPIPLLLATGTGLILGYLRLNIWLFEQKHVVAALPEPLIGASAAFVALVMVRVILASRFLGRFIPVEAARGILMAERTAEAVNATVIVTDIRGYTTLSETRTPVEMLHLLNEYHSVTVDIYHKHGGNVLTFQGDAQLVVFGFPRRLDDAAGASVTACVEVMKAIDELRAEWGIKERKNFDVGAGICTGMVYIGDIGSADQANYTVIGEVVRTSHKVQSMSDALEGNVLMDEHAYEACRNKPRVTRIPGVMLDGFPEPKVLYRVEPDTP